MSNELEQTYYHMLEQLQLDFEQRVSEDPSLLTDLPDDAFVALQLEASSNNPIIHEALASFNQWVMERAQAEAQPDQLIITVVWKSQGVPGGPPS